MFDEELGKSSFSDTSIVTTTLLASVSQVCMAIPIIVASDGADLELAVTPAFDKDAGIAPNAGTLGDRIAIDSGHFAKIAASNPTDASRILGEALSLGQKLTGNSVKFAGTVVANPTNPGILKD
ncbi:hypothetical protein Dda_9351 [Drechslerella dactyloides]|uniref:Uncharacterized protein n=1 Tax=Drechslerella dactyloides TaxID=74499 RepID=A0AAD6NF89_DREDA|nr:hypothetical protein Dda_9351 [Drechslerella dactyloides]